MTWADKFEVDPETGCHVWLKARQTRGYGVVWFQGKVRLAHRVAWFHHYGEWPIEGMVLDHACNNRGCVNVAHLREMTNGDNIQRAYPRGDAATELRRLRWRESQARLRTRGGG